MSGWLRALIRAFRYNKSHAPCGSPPVQRHLSRRKGSARRSATACSVFGRSHRTLLLLFTSSYSPWARRKPGEEGGWGGEEENRDETYLSPVPLLSGAHAPPLLPLLKQEGEGRKREGQGRDGRGRVDGRGEISEQLLPIPGRQSQPSQQPLLTRSRSPKTDWKWGRG